MSKVLTPILLIIAGIGLIFTYLKPAYENLGQFQAQEVEIDAAIKDANRLVSRYDELRKLRSSINVEESRNLEQILPDAIDVVGLIIDADSLASIHNLKIESFEVPYIPSTEELLSKAKNNQNKEPSPVGEAVLTIEFSGEYKDFKNFLFEIEKSMTLLDVVLIDIEVSDGMKPKTEEGIKYVLGLQGYWLIQNE